jgi:hypothetical protein
MIEEPPEGPAFAVTETGLAVILKGDTLIESFTNRSCVCRGLLVMALTVKVYAPSVVDEVVVTFNVEVAVPPAVSVTGVGLKMKMGQMTLVVMQLVVGAKLPVRATDPARPPRLVKVMVERPKAAWGIVNDRGLAETAKLQTLTVTLTTAPR